MNYHINVSRKRLSILLYKKRYNAYFSSKVDNVIMKFERIVVENIL